MTTQEDKILKALKNNPSGLHPTYFIQDLFVYQYNARINGLRERFGCTHKNGNNYCNATEHIVNTRLKNGTTLFTYENKKMKRESVVMTDYLKEYQEKKSESDYKLGLFI